MPRIRLPGRTDEYIDFTLTLPKGRRKPDSLAIYLHGFSSHHRGEKALYFRDRFNEIGAAFLAFDHRGHGNSSGRMEELTVTRNLEDIETVLTSQGAGFKHRILIGSSMGGQTAAWYAARHPDRIAANLLIAPGFGFLERRMSDLGPNGLEMFRTEGKMTIKNEWIEATIGWALLEDGRQYPVKKLLSDYRTPTLILHGTEDEAVPFEDSVDFARQSSARPLELLLIAGGDHRLTDHKENLFLTMQTFCKRLGLL
ncbi:MAG: alpha/beta fold hydrolase [Nitrospirae bacterium]|nr:alpha/beta fold hydrolase [Nitrospirota bacterium]